MAVKIINHDRNVGNNFDAMRESVLCSNINHPNVVMTYKARLSTRPGACAACRLTVNGVVIGKGMPRTLVREADRACGARRSTRSCRARRRRCTQAWAWRARPART